MIDSKIEWTDAEARREILELAALALAAELRGEHVPELLHKIGHARCLALRGDVLHPGELARARPAILLGGHVAALAAEDDPVKPRQVVLSPTS